MFQTEIFQFEKFGKAINDQKFDLQNNSKVACSSYENYCQTYIVVHDGFHYFEYTICQSYYNVAKFLHNTCGLADFEIPEAQVYVCACLTGECSSNEKYHEIIKSLLSTTTTYIPDTTTEYSTNVYDTTETTTNIPDTTTPASIQQFSTINTESWKQSWERWNCWAMPTIVSVSFF